MALSDCTECWLTPCECGYEFKLWSRELIGGNRGAHGLND